MARQRTTDTTQDTTVSTAALTPPAPSVAATWPTRSLRTAGDNPFTGHVSTALENSGTPYEVPAPDAKTARTWEGLIRQAAKAADATVNVYVRELEDGSAKIFYRVTPGRSERTRNQTYTADDVRVWARSDDGSAFLRERGIDSASVVDGKAIPGEVRRGYREAHGLPVK